MDVQQRTRRSGIDTDWMDRAVRPQDDLFRHVNGRWLLEHEIPADRAIDGSFHRLRDLSETRLRAIVEEAADGRLGGDDAAKVGALYAAFMDEERVEALGAGPLLPDLELVAAATGPAELLHSLGALARTGVGGPFHLYVTGDARQADVAIGYLTQAGLGLPDESYYRDETYADIRAAYLRHVGRMLELAGRTDAADAAVRVLALETRLAAAHWDRVSNRDATRTYTKLDRAGLAALAPGIDWTAWLAGARVPDRAVQHVVVRQPSYVEALSAALHELPAEDWRCWLTFHVVRARAALLGRAFVEESFDFYGRTLTGAPQVRERWKRGVAVVESALGEVLGRLYVERHFPPEAKTRMVELVDNLVAAYRRSITDLEWMGEETRQRALAKLERFTPKIGYPDRWRDYTALEVVPGDLVRSMRRAEEFEFDRDIAKIGEPVDRDEWLMTPQTVNAYYHPVMNEIVFPAAILQPPFFDAAADDAVNYGAIGAIIGHEIGHGFDDQGSKYDGDGNLNDWWTDTDRAEFDQRTAALVAQYDVLEPRQAPGHHVNGALTVGENIGDLGGLSIAYAAYRIALAGAEPPVLDELTGDQRFFVAWAQGWRTKARDEEVLRRLAVDPHSPDEFRCNAVVRNIDAFHTAFGVQDGDRLWLEPGERVKIW